MQQATRILWATLGSLALALAVIGLLLPLMPTVPFALAAAFCFARSSERIHQWLLNHRHLGPPIRNWQERRSIGRRAKWLATASFFGSVGIATALALPPVAIAAQALTLACCALFIWTRPDA
ncbi:YbaN family protein [Frigidibacter sp. MR17.14]|uniref:YbaN family protein n=1 Tax=Frigidibacter sp. MR17.14 TaxID=3126509 RepID=UPI003012E50D